MIDIHTCPVGIHTCMFYILFVPIVLIWCFPTQILQIHVRMRVAEGTVSTWNRIQPMEVHLCV